MTTFVMAFVLFFNGETWEMKSRFLPIVRTETVEECTKWIESLPAVSVFQVVPETVYRECVEVKATSAGDAYLKALEISGEKMRELNNS